MGLLRIARTPVVTSTPRTTVIDAVHAMDQEGIGAVAVMQDGILCGIFSERDVMLRVVLEHRDPKTTRMKEVMLPVLQIPMTFPVILSAVQAMTLVMTDDPRGIAFPLSLLGVFSTVYLTASYFVFEYLVEE